MINKQKQIELYFKAGGTLTVQQAFHMFHTTELRKIVSRLRKNGMNIISELIDALNGDQYKEYWLAK
jgi:hypothetical protein